MAQAYVADVTKPEHRSRGMGLIGMAFGLGFVLGPLLAGLLLALPVARAWRLRLPFLVAAGFSTLAWILVLTRLPESRTGDGAAFGRAGLEPARTGRYGPAAQGRPAGPARGALRARVRGAGGDVQPLPEGAVRLVAQGRRVRLRLPGPGQRRSSRGA